MLSSPGGYWPLKVNLDPCAPIKQSSTGCGCILLRSVKLFVLYNGIVLLLLVLSCSICRHYGVLTNLIVKCMDLHEITLVSWNHLVRLTLVYILVQLYWLPVFGLIWCLALFRSSICFKHTYVLSDINFILFFWTLPCELLPSLDVCRRCQQFLLHLLWNY